MSEPIVFIARQKVKEGKLEGYKQLVQENVNFIKPNKPNTVGFLNYGNEDETNQPLYRSTRIQKRWSNTCKD